jgi:hypothetical protein
MPEPTTTRLYLRRDICRMVGMKFPRYSSLGYQAISSQALEYIYDTTFLKQPDDYWNMSWFYAVTGAAAGQTRMIVDNDQIVNRIKTEYPVSPAMSAADQYELLDIWSPEEIHMAINDAIRSAHPEFFDTSESVSLCICQWTKEYDLSSISPAPWIIAAIDIERPGRVIRDEVASATVSTVVLETADLSEVNSTWWVSIYHGTGKGQAVQVGSVNVGAKEITVTAWPLGTPGADSRAMVFDPLQQYNTWYPMLAADFDAAQWPGKLRFLSSYENRFPGNRMRIRYIAQPQELATDAATTFVPREYISKMARAILYGMKMDDVRFDRNLFARKHGELMAEAMAYKQQHAYSMPATTMWIEDDPVVGNVGGSVVPEGNPLDW